jgi:hypothetical protein
MDNSLVWDFVSTCGGDDDGPNNPKIEHFGGNYNYYLAREVIQNSLDARDDYSQPVKVVFKLDYIHKKDFPGRDQLSNIISMQIDYNKDNKAALKFLVPAAEMLNNDKIPFLTISDYNTFGLSGNDNDRNGGWYSLVRSTGNTTKTEGGGSFGIGKGAPFAASILRTVFYSTKNKSAVSIFQGKAELVSFKDTDGDVKRGVGSFGLKQNSLRQGPFMPLNFWRKTFGTDVTIAGYKESANWQDDLLASVLRNFWYAILKEDLTVRIQEIQIDHKNLDHYMVKRFLHEDFKDHVKPVGNPLKYYLAVKEGTELSQNPLPILGNCKFFFKHIEKPMNYVAMVRRSHMVIYSRAFYFPTPYAGVFICDDKHGDEELRSMEPPAHDDWDPNRNESNGKNIYEEITGFIRSRLDTLKENQNFEPLDIPELYKYLPYDEDTDNNSYNRENENESTSENEAVKETFNRIQKKETFNKSIEILPTELTVLNPSDKKNPGSVNLHRNKGTNRGNKNRSNSNSTTDGLSSKIFLTSQKGKRLTYKLYLKSATTTRYNILLKAIGEDIEEPINIIEATSDGADKVLYGANKIRLLLLNAEQEKYVNITIDFPVKLALKIFAHVIH